MKRKLLAITLTLAMLASLFSVAGVITVSAATNLGTPVDSMDDLPDTPNLIEGVYPLAPNSTNKISNPASGNWATVTDGLLQGVNQKAKWNLTENPTYTYNSVAYKNPVVPADWVAENYPELDATKTWYLDCNRYGGINDIADTRVMALANKDNGTNAARPVYDLGQYTKVEKILIGGSAEPVGTGASIATIKASEDKEASVSAAFLEEKLVPKTVASAKDNTIYNVKVYVSDVNKSGGNICSEDNLVLSFDNTDIKSQMSIATLYDVDTVKWGRYVCIDVSYSLYGSHVRVSELGVYGTQTGVLSADQLPTGTNLIAGREPTNIAGTGVPGRSQGSGPWSMVTDGLVQGINQQVIWKLTDQQTVTKGSTTYYNRIASTAFVEKYFPGYDTSKTWYLLPENYQYLGSNCGETRVMLPSGSAKLVYDLGTTATIEELLIASTYELAGLSANSATTPEAAQTVSLSTMEDLLAKSPSKGNSLLYKADVYIADTRAELQNLSTANKVVSYNWSSSAMELANKFKLDEPVMGRYILFDLSGSTNGSQTRISELAVYGSTPVTLYSADELTASIPDPATNILKNAIDAKQGAADVNPFSFAPMTGILVDGFVGTANTEKVVAGTQGAEYIYFTYDMETAYDIDSLYYAGDSSTGANSVAVYVGNKTIEEIIANPGEPDYYYDGGIGDSFVTNNKTKSQAIRFDVDKTGRYVTFRLGTCENNRNIMVWVGEFAATGTPVTISTGGAQMRDKTATSNYAVRFGFHMATDSIGYADADPVTSNNYARADLTDASMTVINGKAVQVVDFGAVVSNASSQTAEGLVLENCSDDAGSQTKKVAALNLYAVNDGYISYTAVVTNIPTGFEDRALYARPYITYMDGDVQKTIYGEMHTTSVEAELAKIA